MAIDPPHGTVKRNFALFLARTTDTFIDLYHVLAVSVESRGERENGPFSAYRMRARC